MASQGKCVFIVGIYVICLLIGSVISQCSNPPPDPVLEVSEKDGQGHVLFSLSGTSSTASWTLSVVEKSDSLSQYLQSYFRIQSATSGWQVVLVKQLDVEEIYKNMNATLTSVELKLECTGQAANKVSYTKMIIVNPVSEFPPQFSPAAPRFNVSEDAAVGSTLFYLNTVVTDEDVRGLGLQKSDVAQFSTHSYNGDKVSGDGIFEVRPSGSVLLLRELDFEARDISFYINVTVEDLGGLSNWAVIEIDVENINDNSPVFISEGSDDTEESDYRATIDPDFTGEITSLSPGPIQAADADGDNITYDIIAGSPTNYSKYVTMDPVTGKLTIIQSLRNFNISHLSLVIQARDVSSLKEARTVNLKSLAAVNSLLILIAGRQINFPAVPTGTSSTSSNFDEDAMFASVIVLAVILFFALIVVFLMACWVWHIKKHQTDKYKTSNHHRGSGPGTMNMRPINRSSEKEFMRSLSSGGHSNKEFDSNENDDVFTTDIATYYDLRGIMQRPSDTHSTATTQLVPFHDALAFQDEMAFPAKISSDVTHKTDPSDNLLGFEIPDTSLQQIDPSRLDSQFQALDLLTSVAPLKRESTETAAEADDDNAKSVRSWRNTDVISELEEIAANQRVKPSRKQPRYRTKSESLDSQRTSVSVPDFEDEGITSFVGSPTGPHSPQVGPLEDRRTSGTAESVLRGGAYGQYRSLQPGNPFAEDVRQLKHSSGGSPEQNNSEINLMSDDALTPVYPMEEWTKTSSSKTPSQESRNSVTNSTMNNLLDEEGQITVYL